MIDLTPIFRAVIALLAALITYRLIPWIKARTTNEQQVTMKALVRTLVFAAEQMYGAGNGPEKLQWVQYQLKMAGFDIDVAEIEAAVYENINFFKDVPVATKPPDEN